MIEDAHRRAPSRRSEKLKAPSVKPGKYDLVLDPSHTWLTIHESVGHPLELDRVLGYEANYAGTSFATLDKREAEVPVRQRQGQPRSPTRPSPAASARSATTTKACKTKRWDLVKDGMLVNYQAIRDQAHILGENGIARLLLRRLLVQRAVPAHGQCLAAAGQGHSSASADMIKDVENGIYIIGDGSFSIDQQRYNAQFGGQLFYEIKNGKIARHARGRRLPDPHARVLERLRRRSATRATTASAARSSTARASPARSRRSRTARARRASTASTSSTPPAASADRIQETTDHEHPHRRAKPRPSSTR